MQTLHSKNIIGTPFRITTESVQNRPGTWNSTKVSIYRDSLYDIKENIYHEDFLIGEYLRNYSSYGMQTFYPFQIGEEWYALYSTAYTSTRVMKLYKDHIEDWCGEEPSANGFCPVEYYIPRYIHSRYKISSDKDDMFDTYYVDCDFTEDEYRKEINKDDFVGINYCNFGFLCGCIWGDDTAWKLRYIDLARIPEKILTITDKFGYHQIPNTLTLRQSIRMDGWEPDHSWVELIKSEHVNLVTDARC